MQASRLLAAGLAGLTLSLAACTTTSLPQYANGLAADNARTACGKDIEFLRQLTTTDGNSNGALLNTSCPLAETAVATVSVRSPAMQAGQ